MDAFENRQSYREAVPGPANLLRAAVASHGYGLRHGITLDRDVDYRCTIAGDETADSPLALKIEQCARAGSTAQTTTASLHLSKRFVSDRQGSKPSA